MDKAKRKHSFSDRTFELQMQSAPPPLRSRDLLLGSLCEKCSRQDGHITNPTGNSGGVGVPAGALGSKKPSGFGRLFTSSMFRAAAAASRKPAFNPTLGSCALTRPPQAAAAINKLRPDERTFAALG